MRDGSDAGLSFLSSHTAISFAVATSSYLAMRRRHGSSAVTTATLVVGLTLASFVGVSRVLAGQHFITDVVGGAIVGSSTGILIPALHSAPVTVVPQVSADTKAIALVGWF